MIPAETPDTSDLHTLQRSARAARQAFAGTFGPFVRSMRRAMDDFRQAREAGMSQADAERGLEAVLRDSWEKPATKFPPLCDACDDVGWREMTCWSAQRCGRKICTDMRDDWGHFYVESCGCVAGDKLRKKTRTYDEGLAAVGRRKKPALKGFNRL